MSLSMSEPIKLVVFVSGGVVQDILTCGVPVEVAVIDYDCDEDDDGLTEQYPVYSDPKETETERGNGFVWALTGDNPANNAYAKRCFDIARRADSMKVGDSDDPEVAQINEHA